MAPSYRSFLKKVVQLIWRQVVHFCWRNLIPSGSFIMAVDKPYSPYLNGKVERSQRTDLDEFYGNLDLREAGLADKLIAWQEYYNKQGPHSSLQQKTRWEKYESLKNKIPSLEEIHAIYIRAKEDTPYRTTLIINC